MIVTDRLKIVPFGEEHLTARYVGWLNDPEVMKYSEQRHRQHTLESGRAYWQSFIDTPHFFLAVEATATAPSHIGTMTVYVDVPNKVADVGIMIGERDSWGQGFGLEAWQAVCRWLLNDRKIRKITAGTVRKNKAMLAIMERVGMKSDGIRQEERLIDGKPMDVVHMALFNNITNDTNPN